MQITFNLFREVRFIVQFKEWLCLLSYTNRMFSWLCSQQFSSCNSAGLIYSCKYLQMNSSNSPGISTLIYWEILAGMLPRITLWLTLLTSGVITQLKYQTVQRVTQSITAVTNKDVVLWQDMGWDLRQKVIFMSTFLSPLFDVYTSQKIGYRINKLSVNILMCPSICRSDRKLKFWSKVRMHVSFCRTLAWEVCFPIWVENSLC